MKEPKINRGSSKQSVIEWLLRPVTVLMERRVRLIINSIVEMFPDNCPHCGKEIEFPSQEKILARQILRGHTNDESKTRIIGDGK